MKRCHPLLCNYGWLKLPLTQSYEAVIKVLDLEVCCSFDCKASEITYAVLLGEIECAKSFIFKVVPEVNLVIFRSFSPRSKYNKYSNLKRILILSSTLRNHVAILFTILLNGNIFDSSFQVACSARKPRASALKWKNWRSFHSPRFVCFCEGNRERNWFNHQAPSERTKKK